MSAEEKKTVAYMVREHNSLNGFRLVIIEFLLVVLAAGLISLGGILHGRLLIAVSAAGIVLNAAAVIAIARAQMRHGEPSYGILKFRSLQFRAQVGPDHPRLTTHTLVVFGSVLIPFLLVALLYLQRPRPSPGKRS
jgi:hypothetical protein